MSGGKHLRTTLRWWIEAWKVWTFAKVENWEWKVEYSFNNGPQFKHLKIVIDGTYPSHTQPVLAQIIKNINNNTNCDSNHNDQVSYDQVKTLPTNIKHKIIITPTTGSDVNTLEIYASFRYVLCM